MGLETGLVATGLSAPTDEDEDWMERAGWRGRCTTAEAIIAHGERDLPNVGSMIYRLFRGGRGRNEHVLASFAFAGASRRA